MLRPAVRRNAITVDEVIHGHEILGKFIDIINASHYLDQTIALTSRHPAKDMPLSGLIVAKEELPDWIGKQRAADCWFPITQERVNQFADVTLDHQYIHIDPERAAKTIFGGTVAHGLLTLSLLPHLLEAVQLAPENIVMGINYGFNRVRYPSPVPVGSEIRAVATLNTVDYPATDRVATMTDVVIEIKGQEKPALVAESLAMFIVGKTDHKPAQAG